MRVCHLKLNSFRNYPELELTPGQGLNILHGENAQGKTNVLEALSLLATTRSLRAGRESELILRDKEMAHVQAEIDREREGDAEIQVSVFQGDKKSVRVNGVKRARVIDLLGQFNAVFFGSIDLVIVTGEPADRRHYLNVEISQISPRYVYDLGHYKRILAHRNRLLRDLRDSPRRPEESGLDVWNDQLVSYGARLFEKRKFYLERLAPLAEQTHRELTDGKETLEVRYQPNIVLPALSTPESGTVREASREEKYLADAEASIREPDAEKPESKSERQKTTSALLASAGSANPLLEAIAAQFTQQLTAVGLEEMRRGTTLIGPQRDDLCFLINGADARIYGSQGQQRTVALSLKLAEFRLIEDYVGEPPVMLLDDVMSDLDDSRRKHLLQWVRRRCQTFITCTNLRSFPKEILAEATTFQVVAGTVTPDGTRKNRSSAQTERGKTGILERGRQNNPAEAESTDAAGDRDRSEPPEPTGGAESGESIQDEPVGLTAIG